MAKKKTTKKAKKRKKRAKKLDPLLQFTTPEPHTVRFNGYTEIEARCILHNTILKIAEACPEVEATGEMIMPEGDSFKFTIYHDVRTVVDPLLIKHKLTFCPYSDANHKTKVTYDHGWHYIETHFALTDAKTGYREIIPAAGVGHNRYWAVDSAGTLALKHALLETLHIKWDNRTAVQVMINDVEKAAPMMVGQVVKELMKLDWFAQKVSTETLKKG